MTLVGYDARDEILSMLSCCLRTSVFHGSTLPKQRRRCAQ